MCIEDQTSPSSGGLVAGVRAIRRERVSKVIPKLKA